ncbi:MAG: four helix bundle protein [Bacteroidetes bacterium]|nr:four helix bundle protein [Bacteroidota bacterium]MBU1114012.1 four helix bundle protein [Bacteroidota bacterium]MBU1798788.1 four helix bundle protein [Bacteroidota bacterium]
MEIKRKNINRGYTKLRVWEDSVLLFKLVYKTNKNFPYELSKSRNNILDAAHSISRNIAEGYCRKNLKEYLNFLNIALGSCGELLSGIISFKAIEQIDEINFEILDELHFKVENELLGLIKSLQKKQNDGDWEDKF